MQHRTTLGSVLLGAVVLTTCAASGCKRDGADACRPDTIEWGVSVVIDATDAINPNEHGEPLPTFVRVYQVRGSSVSSELDADTLWASEDAEALGAPFLAVDQAVAAPGRRNVLTIPLHEEATHLLAAGHFRETFGSSWFELYEIPKSHPASVCARDPVDQNVPDPCFFVRLDGSEVSGGTTAPPTMNLEGLACAPISAAPKPTKRRRWWKRRKTLEVPEDPLREEAAQDRIDEESQRVPTAPSAPQRPRRPPARPELPSAPRPGVP